MMVVFKVMNFKRIDFIFGYFLLFVSSLAIAEEVGGHIKYQFAATHYQNDHLYAQHGSQSQYDHFLDFRLTAEDRWGVWDAQVHYEVLSLYGDTPKTKQALNNAGLAVVPTLTKDKRRLFRLTDEWGNSEKLEAVQRLDRLFVGYNGEALILRFGRQAVSWGHGFIFQPLDIFSPFSPTEIDKDYKTGDDMLYGQWLFENDDDIQMILLPRRNIETNQVDSEESSLAFKYHGRYWEQWDIDLLAARNFDENVFGFGLTKDIFEALWRFDISATRLKEGRTAISVVTNMDYSWNWFKKNFYGYLEYFRNGVGEKQLNLNVALQSRLERGEIFTRNRNYLGSGLQIELTPLFNFHTNWIGNLHDSSGLFQIRGIYDWLENVQLIGWLDLPYGDSESELGENSGSGNKAYFRLIYYF